MTVGVEIINDSGVILLESTRNTIALLGKDSVPSGTLFQAQGASHTYAFGFPQGASSYGLTTYDAAGVVLFDAVTYGRTAKPVAVMSGSIASVNTQTISQTFTSGRTYAVWIHSPIAPLRVRSVARTIGGVVNYFYVMDDQSMSVAISGANVSITASRTVSTTENGGGTTPYDSVDKSTWLAIVLDVTHY